MSSRLAQLATDLEKIELTSDRDMDTYAKTLRALSLELYLRVGMDAEVIQGVLSQYKGRWYTFGTASRLKARLVAAHLKVGAEAAKVIGTSGLKMHAAFKKHFVEPEMAAKAQAGRKSGGFTIGDAA